MQNLRSLLNKQSLRTRLVIWFLVIALLPLAWTTILTYALSKKSLFTQAVENLQTFMVRQEKLIHFYFEELKVDLKDFTQHPSEWKEISLLDNILSHFGKDSVEYQKEADNLYSDLALRLRYLDYQNLFFLTKSGKVVFSILPFNDLGKQLNTTSHAVLAPFFEISRHTLKTEVTTFVLVQDSVAFNIYASIPLMNSQHQVEGFALIELSISSLYGLLGSYNQGGPIVDLLGTKMDKTFWVITPLDGQIQYLREEVDPSSQLGNFIQEVFSQEKELTTHVDYQNEQTLMLGKKLPTSFNWIMIASISEAILLAPIKQLQYLFWIIGTLTAFFVILAASNAAHKIASPILLLTHKTKILASGDLSQRIQVQSQDEIGKLGQSFNDMAAQLDHLITNLDDLVEKRTKEYEIQNIQLEQTIQELHHAQDQLIIQEKLASLGALTAGIAHEIKNPLNFINNFAELSLQYLEELKEHLNVIDSSISLNVKEDMTILSDTLKLNLSKIYEHGKRADSIVRTMLQHSRAVPGESISTDIHKLLEEYIAFSYHGMRAQDSTFNVKIETSYDPTITPIKIVPQEISRVFLNLLNNAYYSIKQKKKQHLTDNSYQPIVRISTENRLQSVAIKIWDNGLGIPASVSNKLFTPFFTTKPTGEGTGLGLSLSYNIVVQGHGGTLTARSEEGEFAEFTITLPQKTSCL